MKRKSMWLMYLLTLICAGVLAAYLGAVVLRRDTEAPVITINQDELYVSVTDVQKLYEGVSAYDDVDGDVTFAVVIESISDIDNDRCEITYAAFDAAGNISRASRTLVYTDYQKPRFILKDALYFIDTTSPDVLKTVGAFDVLDGDISHRVKANLVSDTISLSYPGVHQVQFRVSNTMGDTVHLELPVDVVQADTYNAYVYLSDYLIYLNKGDEFNVRDYMDYFSVGGTKYSLRERQEGVRVYIDNYVNPAYDTGSGVLINVDTEHNVNTSVPGVYNATYTVTMTRGTMAYTGFCRLHVVVEE